MLSGVDLDPRFIATYANDSKVMQMRSDIGSKQDELIDIILSEEEIDASKVLRILFPEMQADVFISHSRDDKDKAYKISKDLYDAHGLRCFIDSEVWGSAYDLLKAIDDKYCKSVGGEFYDYKKRNLSTAHVYTVLNTALQRVMYNCKYFLFLRTDASTKLSSIGDSDQTYSPWIHMELSFSSMIIKSKIQKSMEGMVVNEDASPLRFFHDLNTDHLSKRDWRDYDPFVRGEKTLSEFFSGI
ncbi:toll/interleukin-1 receptor domain-containing protein [Chromohalobacter israelensis]|uniref:toll/interleukin-1 receptor domain-containing protein n=1 Tax=Chromohalobacter israelensis TaxID=141390 RepID=UPI0015C4AFF7|nr:toll/interleukin-1 receptor domain-containing protein [Chromohalobacter salexigens]